MKKNIIKSAIILVLFFVGSEIIQTYLPWNEYGANFFARFYFSSMILYTIIGLIFGCNSFKTKKWNAKQNLPHLIFASILLLFLLYISGIGISTGQGIFSVGARIVRITMELIDNGMLIILPILIGFNISKIIFEEKLFIV